LKSKKNLKIGIVGHGFVGKATDFGFSISATKFIVDPLINTNIDELSNFSPDVVFVCVPTPMGNNGTQDSSIIEGVVKELKLKCSDSIVVVKSTVLPSILDKIVSVNKNIIYNPEFLRENYANEDFVNSEMIILGGNKKIASKVSSFYSNHSKCLTKNHVFMDIRTASLLKYSINTFLASKVLFFNEIFEIFEKLESGESWQSFIETISTDSRIGKSHMNVPGHDGKKGFGGACFPKDTTAFLNYAKSIGVNFESLKAIIKKNNKIRKEYTNLNFREKAQNVSFDDKI